MTPDESFATGAVVEGPKPGGLIPSWEFDRGCALPVPSEPTPNVTVTIKLDWDPDEIRARVAEWIASDILGAADGYRESRGRQL